MNKIIEFKNEYRFLSNFYFLEYQIIYQGICYNSVENAYQAQKTNDLNIKLQISRMTPAASKKFARSINMRKDWDDIKLVVMKKFVEEKFLASLELKRKLIDLKDYEIIEGNFWHDNYWGICYCKKCAPGGIGNGKNMMGKILMDLRDSILQLGKW